MSRTPVHCTTTLLLILTFTSINAFSQSGSALPIPAAPIPVQIINGKNVFIANLLAENGLIAPVTEHRGYDAFYAAIKNGRQYHLVATPGDADLVFQLSTADGLQLTIIDPHTNIALWSIRGGVPSPHSHSISDVEKAIQSSTAALAFDLQKLIASAAASSATLSK
jgi:hypothetical protein